MPRAGTGVVTATSSMGTVPTPRSYNPIKKMLSHSLVTLSSALSHPIMIPTYLTARKTEVQKLSRKYSRPEHCYAKPLVRAKWAERWETLLGKFEGIHWPLSAALPDPITQQSLLEAVTVKPMLKHPCWLLKD